MYVVSFVHEHKYLHIQALWPCMCSKTLIDEMDIPLKFWSNIFLGPFLKYEQQYLEGRSGCTKIL